MDSAPRGAKGSAVDSPLVELALSAASSESRNRRYVEALYTLGNQATTLTGESQILSAALDALAQGLAADRLLAMTGRNADAMSVVARKLRDPEAANKLSLPSKEIVAKALSSERAIVALPGSAERGSAGQPADGSAPHPTICVALRLDETCIGLLYADQQGGASGICLEDGNFVEVVGRLATLGIVRLRVQSQLKHALSAPAGSPPGLQVLSGEVQDRLTALQLFCGKTLEERGSDDALAKIQDECRDLRETVEELVEQVREKTCPGLGPGR